MGWESGAAFGKEVSHDKILSAVWSLRQTGYQPGYILIDEGWQEGAMMHSFEADSKRFSFGLKGLVEELQRAGIKHVGVWTGYDGGISPELAEKYKINSDQQGRYLLGEDLGRTFQFFFDFYGYLREQGIAFVKMGGHDQTERYQNIQAAAQAASSIQLDTAHFNSDSLRNENIYHWTTSRVARTAENIDIRNPIGAKRAIRNNLTNSLWMQHLMDSDFDAWVSNAPHSEMLAIFHALSGSINIIGDMPASHDKNLLGKVVLPCGKLLKADAPLTLCVDSAFINPLEQKAIYKAFTFKGDCGIVGAFNLTSGKRSLHGTISPADIEGITGQTFAVLSHRNGFVGLVERDDHLNITLKPDQCDVFTFAPIQEGIAVFGCYPFYLAPGPITEINIEEDSMHISSLVEAPMIIYCERGILEIRRNGEVIPWEYDSKRKTLSIDSRSHIQDNPSIYTITFES